MVQPIRIYRMADPFMMTRFNNYCPEKLSIKEVRAYCSAHVSAQVYVTSYTNDLQLLYSATIHKYVSLVRLTELMGKYANTA